MPCLGSSGDLIDGDQEGDLDVEEEEAAFAVLESAFGSHGVGLPLESELRPYYLACRPYGSFK
jgi:hypothetical protein